MVRLHLCKGMIQLQCSDYCRKTEIEVTTCHLGIRKWPLSLEIPNPVNKDENSVYSYLSNISFIKPNLSDNS